MTNFARNSANSAVSEKPETLSTEYNLGLFETKANETLESFLALKGNRFDKQNV